MQANSTRLSEPITNRRKKTRSSIYHYIYHQKEFVSKQVIAHDLGLSLPTVYQNIDELKEAGLIDFTGEKMATGGRQAQGIDIVADARVAIGISITDSRIRLSVANLRLQELCYLRIKRDLIDGKEPLGKDFGKYLGELLEKFIDDNGIDRQKILGVGVAIPAILDPAGNSILNAPTLHLNNVSLDEIYANIPYTVRIMNDGTCAGHAEWFARMEDGQVNPDSSIAYLSLENGVGGSIILNGHVFDGDHLRSGEFGHMCVEMNGRECHCGQKGCLEAYCSASRCSDDLGITLEEFFDEIAKGNKDYYDLWQDMLRHLAVGINNISMALNCNVVLGGFLSRYIEPWLPQLREYVCQSNPFSSPAAFVSLSVLENRSVPLGAALVFIEEFLNRI